MKRALLLLVIAGPLIALLAVGCGKGRSSPTGSTGDPTGGSGGRAASPIGYSNVSTLNAAQAEQILAAGLTLVQAEASGTEWPYDLGRLKAIAQVVRRHNATFFLTVVNWNELARRNESDAWFIARVDEIARDVGTANVWLEGVSEPDGSDKTLRWQRIAKEHWPGTLVGNGPGGRGRPDVSAEIIDWHYCEIEDLIRSIRADRLHSTDCTPALASNLTESDVRRATQAALRAGARMLLYDTSNVGASNANVIRWMSEEIRNAGG